MPRGRRPGPKVKVPCPACGKVHERPAWEARRGKRFCDDACYATWATGRTRGPYKGHEPEERRCEVCGKPFLVGGRGRPSRRARKCSPECRAAGRFRSGAKTNKLRQTDAAYLAGLVDGEGSIMLYMRRDVVALRLAVTNTYRPVLDWIAEITGVGKVHAQYPARPSTLEGRMFTRKATWAWNCNAQAAETLLAQLRPHLRIKPAQADLALEVQARLRDPAAKADRTWHLAACERMRKLNRRGPPA
jgi:hypothetical protein